MPGKGARRRSDEGFSLMEMLVVMALFTGLMVIVFAILITLTNQANDNLARARSVEQARLGISQIDKQVRSGNLILNPLDETLADSGVDPGYSLRIYTQEGGDDLCVQWRVFDTDNDGFSDLQFRSWEPGLTATVTNWIVVAQNSVAAPNSGFDQDNPGADPKSWPPFFVDATANTSKAQNVRITLRMSDPQTDHRADPVTVTTVVTGRNTVFGYASNNCSPVPAP